MSTSKVRVMYLRDVNYFPIGCAAISLDREKNRIKYQLSVLNPIDKFDRKTARLIAMDRLLSSPSTVRIPENVSMHQISQAVMEDIVKHKGAPSRAIKAAKLWLKYLGA